MMKKEKKKPSVAVRVVLALIAVIAGVSVGMLAAGMGMDGQGTDVQGTASQEAVLVDNSVMKAEFLGFENHPELGAFLVKVKAENRTGKEIWVSMDKASINDETMQMVMTGVPFTIQAGKKGSTGFIYYLMQTGVETFEDVKEVAFRLRVMDNETMDDIWVSDEIVVKR